MSMDFDMSEFVRGVTEFQDKLLKAAHRGAGQAASALLNDTIMEMPSVPLEEGTLRGSGSVFVQNELESTAPNVGGSPTPATQGDETLTPDTITAVAGFNTDYAAYQHEGERKEGTHVVAQQVAERKGGKRVGPGYSHSGVGKKFLEKKLYDNADEYIAIAAKEVKGAMGDA